LRFRSRHFLFLVGLLLGLLTARPAHAAPWKPKLENRLTLLPSYYFEDVGQGTTQWASVITEESAFSFRPARDLKVRLAPWFYGDPSSTSQRERFIADVNEANIDWRFGDWQARAGINSVAWGVTDVFNPLDVVSARRYTDPLNSEKRGVPSFDLSWEREGWRAEAIYVPFQQESILPGENSRWLPRDISFSRTSPDFRATIAPQFKYAWADKVEFDDALKNNYGFRLERHGSGLDLTAIFFQGAPTAPAIFTPVINGYTDPTNIKNFYATDITLQPRYYLRRTVGIGAVWTLETMIVRFAAANSDRISVGQALPGWAQSAVLGIEKNFPIATSTLTMVVQGTWGQHEDQADNSITSLDRIFDKSGMLALRLATDGNWAWNVATLYDGAYAGWYGLAKTERKISDGFTASLQGDYLDGPAGTPLGTYRRNKRLTLGLAVFF
jgi:hypothetical protein